MKITNKSVNVAMEFRNIKAGEAFYYQFSDAVFMKTETLREDNGLVIANAVNLKNGTLFAFNEEHHVIAIDCECIVTNKKEE